jgi:hypothetical protein
MWRWEVFIQDECGSVHQFYSTRSFTTQGECEADLNEHCLPHGAIEQHFESEDFCVLDVEVILEV